MTIMSSTIETVVAESSFYKPATMTHPIEVIWGGSARIRQLEALVHKQSLQLAIATETFNRMAQLVEENVKD